MNKLCILIVNYNSTNYTLELIENLKKSNYNKFDILVFDNNSKEDISKLEKIKGVRIIKNYKNLGLTGGVNKGLCYLKNKYVLLLNPDIDIDKNTVKELLDVIEKDDKIAFAAGAIYNSKQRDKIDAFGGKISFWTGIGKPLKREDKIRELNYGEYTDACILMFNREIFQKLGGYDEKYFMYNETEDIQLRAIEKGYKIYINPNAKVWHKVYGSSGSKKSKFSVYYLTRNRFLFMKKNVNSLRYALFLILNLFLILPLQLFLFLLRRQINLIGSFMKGAFDGIFLK